MICQRGVRLPAPTAPGLKMRPTQRPAAGGGAIIAEGGLAPFTPARPLLALFDADNDQLFSARIISPNPRNCTLSGGITEGNPSCNGVRHIQTRCLMKMV